MKNAYGRSRQYYTLHQHAPVAARYDVASTLYDTAQRNHVDLGAQVRRHSLLARRRGRVHIANFYVECYWGTRKRRG